MNTTLKMRPGKNCWDNLTLIIREGTDVPMILPLRDRNSALEIFRQCALADFGGRKGDLTVDVDGKEYSWSEVSWRSILSVFDQWYEEYMMYVEAVGVVG